MYERSAIVLEKNFNTILGFDKKPNLKTIYKDYKEITEEIQKYQSMLEEEDKIINEFDDVANNIRLIQQEQKKIYKSNIKLEEERNQFFDNLEEEPDIIERKLIKIENNILENNKKLEELRKSYVTAITEFAQKQQDRNICSKNRRAEEKRHLQLIEKITNDFNDADKGMVKEIKDFISTENTNIKKEIQDIMIDNGKDERIPFNNEVIENAVEIRNKIAIREAECFMSAYEKTRRLLTELNNDDIKIDKYAKNVRDISVKLAYLKAMKLYIVSFLDNERMATMNGTKIHKKLMSEACENFKVDIEQFEKLFELILREITNKSSKKAYKELYNKEYLKNIEDKEKNFEEEVNNIKINVGAVVNSNYWRIDEIKNIYNVFQTEVSEKFGKDLSEFKLEDNEENMENIEKTEIDEIEDDIFKTKVDDEDAEYVEEFEFDDDGDFEEEYEEDEYEDEYDDDTDDEYFDDDDDLEDSEDEDCGDEEYEDDFEDEYDDIDEFDDDYDDEDDEDDYNDEDDEDEEKVEHQKSKKEGNPAGKHAKKTDTKKGLFNKLFKDKKD